MSNGTGGLEDLQLEVRDLVVAYDGIQALRGVSFTVLKGEIVTLIGANGAGKTSILRAISGLVLWRGCPVRGPGSEASTGASDRRAGHRPRPGGPGHLRQSDGAGEPAAGDLAADRQGRDRS